MSAPRRRSLYGASKREKYLHFVLVWGLVLKGAFALAEIVAGIGAFFVSQAAVVRIARILTLGELAEDPNDAIANVVLKASRNFSSSAHFMGAYLTSHGVIKLALIVALLTGKRWAYPVAIVVFGGFMAYQMYQYTLSHSAMLVLLTAIDAIVIALTWHEYRYTRNASSIVSLPVRRATQRRPR